jgi:hypothetical protein
LACAGVAVWEAEELADVLRESVVVVAGVVAAVVVAAVLDFADELAVGFALALVLLVLLVLALGVALADEEDVPGEGDGSFLGVADAEAWVVGGSLVEGSLAEGFGLAEEDAELLELGVGVGVGVVGVGVALGEVVAACSGSHCCTVPPAEAAASVTSAA